MLFLLNIKFISLVRQNSVILSLEFCLTSETNLRFNKTRLNILYILKDMCILSRPAFQVRNRTVYLDNTYLQLLSCEPICCCHHVHFTVIAKFNLQFLRTKNIFLRNLKKMRKNKTPPCCHS